MCQINTINQYMKTKCGKTLTTTNELTPNIKSKSIKKHLKLYVLYRNKKKDIRYLKKNSYYRKLHFLRESNDFLLGFMGPKKEITQIFDY